MGEVTDGRLQQGAANGMVKRVLFGLISSFMHAWKTSQTGDGCGRFAGDFNSAENQLELTLHDHYNPWLDINRTIDNDFGHTCYETVDLYTCRLRGQDPLERFHATPGDPITVVGGLVFLLGAKNR